MDAETPPTSSPEPAAPPAIQATAPAAPKLYYRSRLFWVGLLGVLAGTGELIVGWMDEVGIPNGAVVTAVGFLTLALRMLTNQPVAVRKRAVAEGQGETTEDA